LVEQRFFAEIDGWHVSGAIDLQVVDPDGIHIKDYKTTSVWAVMNDKPEWEQQLNIYAWLVQKNKQVPIKSLQIVGILKDWSKREAERKPEYPPHLKRCGKSHLYGQSLRLVIQELNHSMKQLN